jgi:hypothetical protein
MKPISHNIPKERPEPMGIMNYDLGGNLIGGKIKNKAKPKNHSYLLKRIVKMLIILSSVLIQPFVFWMIISNGYRVKGFMSLGGMYYICMWFIAILYYFFGFRVSTIIKYLWKLTK